MTADERVAEVANILAAAVLRLRRRMLWRRMHHHRFPLILPARFVRQAASLAVALAD